MDRIFLNSDMAGFGLEFIFVTQSRIRFENIMNESMEFIVNRLNCKELCLNIVWVRGDSNHGTVEGINTFQVLF